MDFENTTQWFPVQRRAMIFTLTATDLVHMGT